MAIALLAYHYLAVISGARAGRAQLLAATTQLLHVGVGVSQAELDQLDREVRTGRDEMQGAQLSVSRDPLVWLASRLPRVGTQVQAGERLLDASLTAADAGLGVIAAGRIALRERDDPGGGRLTQRAVNVVQESQPYLAQAQRAVERLRETHRQLAGESLLSPLARANEELGTRLPEMERLVGEWQAARQLLPGLLGFEGKRTYLLLALNEGELFPGGGFVTVAGTLTADHGAIQVGALEDTIRFGQEWQDRGGGYVQPPAPLKQYLLRQVTWNLSVSDWSPDFPTNAQRAVEFWKLGGGAPVDGVIAVNLATLRDLLALYGPVRLPDYGFTFTSDNAILELERLTRRPFDPASPDRKAAVGELARALIPRVLSTPPTQWDGLSRTLGELIGGKDLMIWSPDPQQERAIAALGADGAVRAVPSDYLMLVDGSVQSTKLNLIIHPQVDLNVKLSASGGAEHTVTVTYRNDLPSWEKGQDMKLVRQLMLAGVYGDYARLYVPQGSDLTSLKLDGRESGAQAVETELGKQSFARFFTVGSGQTRVVQYAYRTPGVLRLLPTAASYALYLQRQSGASGTWVTLHIDPPPGYHVAWLATNGQVRNGVTDARVLLDRDVLVTVGLERG